MKTVSIFSKLASLTNQPAPLREKPKPPAGEIQCLILHNLFDTISVRAAVRQLARSLGYSLIDQARVSTAVFEIARHIVLYAGQGKVNIFWREDDLNRQGLEFLCHYCGLNEPRLTLIWQTGGCEPNDRLNFVDLKRLVDEFKFANDPTYGNCITLVKWLKM